MEKNNSIPEDVFNSKRYFKYIVEYQGDIKREISNRPGFYVIIINDKYAIVAVEGTGEFELQDPDIFQTVAYVARPAVYTLQEVTPIDAAKINFLQLDLPLNLTGKGIIVGIIDTGIDYLNKEFMTPRGETRIECIWDQTIAGVNTKGSVRAAYGSVYIKQEIQKAINASRDGKSPYEIVPSKDEIGHGTKMAGIIGATGDNPQIRGAVPECSFVVVKLLQDLVTQDLLKNNFPMFDVSSIFTAIEFLYRYSLDVDKPIVIYLPLGTNLGNHKGEGILEQYIEQISQASGIVVVTGTGNQGGKGSHTSGTVLAVGETRAIDIFIPPEQKFLILEIWIDRPNIMSLDIISPSGESTGVIEALINSTENYSFLFERTKIIVRHYLPEVNTGDQLISVRFFNITSGVWKLRVIGNSILDGTFNAWMLQEGINSERTRFIFADPYGTITSPGNSKIIVTVAAYNQSNNNILTYSGVADLADYEDVVDLAAGGINAMTVAPNNQVAVVNGTSVAAAVVAGVCAMLLQWGIIEGNYPYMYSQTIKAYLMRGVSRRSGDIYPNPQWGYGMLNVRALFANII
ncbi:S8 family peptidase [Clostridium cellulovorans]|uniref:Peptidase S8 and S53 subtilisin kexin sedolisin n=1 Tax=Clostridium cellulovorans (strain ATCC 35296 / DSM 3052 / OCM 3 / 743B) TaxID=573061 RepID=D9SWT4_CLOC7|nr:S8 family peptidase [Clostridium cellulovorans]ADL51295.1 peptidase S8 and S53 subtilisin kexin sedolisin [Clostridium cellulovorans 743B]